MAYRLDEMVKEGELTKEQAEAISDDHNNHIYEQEYLSLLRYCWWDRYNIAGYTECLPDTSKLCYLYDGYELA